MNGKFSVRNREAILKQMAEQELDILVIGGGITGAGIALDASQRGLGTGLLEKSDFGSGTSSRSTKLIHGGLRYLKQGDVKLVRELGRERAVLYRNAPHLVTPIPMMLPIYQGGNYGYLLTSIGVYIYDWLAGVPRKERRKTLSREETMAREPLLKSQGLKGSVVYYEYRTDDARLTLDILKTAWKQGARIVNYAQVERFIYERGRVVGVEALDRVSGRRHIIRAKHIVNATGPWVDQIRQMDGSLKGKRLFLTKGVHLVVNYERLPVRQAAYFDSPDGLMIFVIPRGSVTYIGTTDTPYRLSVDKPQTTEEDRDYLLRAVNEMFPEVRLTGEDIQSHWAGLRPLIYEEGKGPSELSRKDEIFISDSGLITIAGGKLTGFRKMAEKAVDLVAGLLKKSTGASYPSCRTDEVVISGGDCSGYASYGECKDALLARGAAVGLPRETVREWLDLYGANTAHILARYQELEDSQFSSAAEKALAAQLMYSVEEEMTVTAADFLRLRTGWLYFQPEKARQERDRVIRLMAGLLQWNDEEIREQEAAVDEWFDGLQHLPVSDKSQEA